MSDSLNSIAHKTGYSPAIWPIWWRGALVRTGELRHARYHLNLKLQPPRSITINQRGDVVES